MLRPSLVTLAIALVASSAAAAPHAQPAPTGTWTTIDDHTHRPRSIVEISERDGALYGRVLRLFPEPGEDPDPRCADCTGTRHDQPVIGMTILWNLRRDGDVWDGGEILDPESGRTYRALLRPVEHGQRLEVRGFIGISVLGRTQVWERAGAACTAQC